MTMPLAPREQITGGKIRVLGTFEAPRAEWDELQENCHSNAFFRFARIPFWKRENGGWIVGDFRFDREKELGFTELFIGPRGSEPCPTGVPRWKGRFHADSFR
jgi:hypothetical protein